MVGTNLVIALVFAALFGTAFVWVAIYFIHQYIHRRCVELDHWFHLITPPSWRRSCRHCEGTGRDYDLQNEKSRSRSKGRSRSRERGRWERSRTRGEGRGVRMIEAGTEWSGNEEQVRMQRPRQMLPASPAMQRAGTVEGYNQWQGWQGQANAGQQMGVAFPQAAVHPQAYPQVYPQTFQQPYPQASPFTMPAPVQRQQPQHVAMPTPGSVTSVPAYRKPTRRAYTAPSERSQQTVPQTKPKAPRQVHKVRETDYIHIVDEFPSIVQEEIRRKQKAEQKAARKARSPSPSSSSTSSGPVEEVPRTSIPQGTQRFADAVPFQFPHTFNAPTSYPRQWCGHTGERGMPSMPNEPRYASPYTRPGGWKSHGFDIEPRRHGPSNT